MGFRNCYLIWFHFSNTANSNLIRHGAEILSVNAKNNQTKLAKFGTRLIYNLDWHTKIRGGNVFHIMGDSQCVWVWWRFISKSNENDVGDSGDIVPLSDINYLIFQMKRTKWPLSFETQLGHKLYRIFPYSEHNLWAVSTKSFFITFKVRDQRSRGVVKGSVWVVEQTWPPKHSASFHA